MFWTTLVNGSFIWQEHRTNKSILEELDVERELMAKVVKLKIQYFKLVMLQGEVPDS